eukprot:s157_g16.t1
MAEGGEVAAPEEPLADWGDDDDVASPSAGIFVEPQDSHVDPGDDREAQYHEGVMVPKRVDAALRNSKSFEEFRKNRPFKFLHLYSGPNDPLGQAVKAEAKRNRLETVVLSLDRELDASLDLADPGSHLTMKQDVARGEWDFTHSGFPCSSFSMAQHHEVPGQPGPVRSKSSIYGLVGNSRSQQMEADKGTRMATQSAEIYQEQVRSCEARKVPPAATLENPPGNEVSGSAWDVPEVDRCLNKTSGKKVPYNTCAYMVKDKVRHLKPGVWAGRMQGIEKLQKVCRCPAWVTHAPLVGKSMTAKAAEYPWALCEAVATEVVAIWKKTLNLEWWRFQMETKAQEVNELQKAWLKNEEKKERGDTSRTPASKRAASIAFKIDNIEDDDLPSSSKGRPLKQIKEEHNRIAVGGMRNPAKSVKRLTQLSAVGKKMAGLWEEFQESHPQVLNVARSYGNADNSYDEEMVKLWREVLKDHLTKIQEKPMVVRENWEFSSPLDADLWEQWGEEASDPDGCLPDFMRRGVPLGMEVGIPPSGVFPVAMENEEINTDPASEFEELKLLRNYQSVREQVKEATIEINRLVEKKFAKRVSWEWIRQTLGETGTVSKLALILKEKEDGSLKRRLVLDMRRSFGNSRSKVEERIVLPRVVDVVAMLQHMWKPRGGAKGKRLTEDRDDFEFYLIDLQDAFCHFPVRKEELRHCVTPDELEQDALVWTAMLFGYRAAPLLMGRLSSALGRFLQSMVCPDLTQLQIYVDDVLIAMLGDRAAREARLAMLLYTSAALGVQVNLRKGERGRRVTWIGCCLEVPTVELNEPEIVILSISQQMIDQVLVTLRSWIRAGMAPIKELKSTTGKLSWIGGILPRLRWTVSVMYATLRDVEKEQREGLEDIRAATREDARSKKGLFPVKRLGGVHLWLLKLFENPIDNLIRIERMKKPPVSMGIITDACPTGWGAILVKVQPGSVGELIPVEAVEGLISVEEAQLLETEWGEASSQAIMEALAVVRAVDKWGAKMADRAIFIRSDSSVALGMTKKLSSPHSSLNFLAAELALRLEKFLVQRVTLHHLRGTWNEEADWLSRIKERGSKPRPKSLDGVRLQRMAPWKASHFWLKAPGATSTGEDKFVPQGNVFDHLATR